MINTRLIDEIYPNDSKKIMAYLAELKGTTTDSSKLTENDVLLITYGDSLISDDKKPLIVLRDFLKDSKMNSFSAVHILPMYPFTSDDGFSVVDYKEINPELGTWNDINKLSEVKDLMFDAVINHISKSSEWFKGYLSGNKKYQNYFIECSDEIDYSKVVRPRALPLYYSYESSNGNKNVWATFSEDQVDLNYRSVDVFLDVLDVLIHYVQNGAKYIRLDAIGFLWKELGTSCIHLPETHKVIQIYRNILDEYFPGTILISETNVPHKENVSYFSKEHKEVHMVYQFALPPLTLHTFITENSSKLMTWVKSLEETKLKDDNTYFNFLASHDGIGLRPTEGILTDTERQSVVDHVLKQGGKINYKNNSDGTKSPYEMNITYFDALKSSSDSISTQINKMIAAHAILMSMKGVPAIYIHSLLGSHNYYKGVEESGINRRINREKLDYHEVTRELENKHSTRSIVMSEITKLLKTRKSVSAFNPYSFMDTIDLGSNVFSIIRKSREQEVLVLVNITGESISLNTKYQGTDLISLTEINNQIELKPHQVMWIEVK